MKPMEPAENPEGAGPEHGPGAEDPGLSSWSERDREALLAAVDESDYSLADWLAALAVFDRWLADQGEKGRPWREVVGYIHCCTLMASPGVALGKLEVIVSKALTDFGFHRIADPQD